jgi:hypothetical protein
MAERRPKSRKAKGLLALIKAIKQQEKPVDNRIDQPEGLRRFARKQADVLGKDSSKILSEGKEGLPLLLYHRSRGEPFKKFILQKEKMAEMDRLKELDPMAILPPSPPGSDYPFLSTGLNRKGMDFWTDMYGDAPSDVKDNLRVLIGMGRVNKLFDYENPKHVDGVINLLRKEKYKRFKKPKSKENKKRQQNTKDKFEDRLVLLKERMLKGDYEEIENNLDTIRKLGYDSFSTFEEGKNIMLFEPNEQFVPLFDPLKKAATGFAKGGMIARNPYDYEPKGI